MKKIFVLMMMLEISIMADAVPKITNVKAEPYSPWGKVMIEYTLSEDIGEYFVDENTISFVDGVGISASNRLTGVVYEASADAVSGLSLLKGTHSVHWEIASDVVIYDPTEVDFRVFLKIPYVGVQLWKDGPYWSIKNIGAEKPEDFGYYFWWGDIIGYKRVNDQWVASDDSISNFSFDSENCPTSGLYEYQLQNSGYILRDGSRVLTLDRDAARIHFGKGWRMAKHSENVALKNNCVCTWTTMNGINGMLVTGKDDYASSSIFFPAAGFGMNTEARFQGTYGYYFSSNPIISTPEINSIDVSSGISIGPPGYGGFDFDAHLSRKHGLPIRPIIEFTNN